MARRLRVLVIAEEAAGMQAVRLLAVSSHEVLAVLTREVVVEGATVAGVASRLGYRVWPARLVREPGFAGTIRQEGVDLLLNVHSLFVLPADVAAAPRIGSFNLHPGPLPRYAGLNVPSWAIYHGEQTHAVTLHWMDGGIDTGAIAYQEELGIGDDDTGLTLSARCARAGLTLIPELLDAAATGTIPRRPQPDVARRYYGREVPQEGRLLWTDSAAQIVNFIRACDYLPFTSPWGHPHACLGGSEILVLKAMRTGERTAAPAGTIGRRNGAEVLVAARDEWVRVQRVQVGMSTFAPADILIPGDRFAIPTRVEEPTHAIP
jgi:methionyl-tRNA formyltransferase